MSSESLLEIQRKSFVLFTNGDGNPLKFDDRSNLSSGAFVVSGGCSPSSKCLRSATSDADPITLSVMDSLLALLHEDDKNVTIAMAQGLVPVLVHLLDSPSSSEMKEKTVAAISRVSTMDSNKHVLIAEGLLLLNHLLRVLDSSSGFAIEKASVALQALSFTKENARVIGSQGGISFLLENCQAGTPGSQASATGVLRNLAVFAKIRENFVEENALVVFSGLASSGIPLAQENAMSCLSNLISRKKV